MMLQARLLIKHFVVVSFLGLGVMSLCVSDLGSKHSVLPEDFRVFALFVSILLIWISLQHVHILHCARFFFHFNSGKHQNKFAANVFLFLRI